MKRKLLLNILLKENAMIPRIIIIDDISKVEDCGDANKKILEWQKKMKNRLSYNEPIITTSSFRLNGEYYELAEDKQ